MAAERRVWCSCVIIDYLKGAERARPCIDIIGNMREGVQEILTSVIAEGEVAHLGNDIPHDVAEGMIREFFGRRYIVRAPYDRFVAEDVRRLIRAHRGLTSLDAAHIATALRWRVPLLETYDTRLLALDMAIGDPPLAIREPRWSLGPLFD